MAYFIIELADINNRKFFIAFSFIDILNTPLRYPNTNCHGAAMRAGTGKCASADDGLGVHMARDEPRACLLQVPHSCFRLEDCFHEQYRFDPPLPHDGWL